nr:hypothetical protein [Microvirga tunisiensis]
MGAVVQFHDSDRLLILEDNPVNPCVADSIEGAPVTLVPGLQIRLQQGEHADLGRNLIARESREQPAVKLPLVIRQQWSRPVSVFTKESNQTEEGEQDGHPDNQPGCEDIKRKSEDKPLREHRAA